MTEFTAEWIAHQRKYITEHGALNNQLCLKLLDEIKRLQKRIEELELIENNAAEYYGWWKDSMKCIEELEAEHHVYCTGDGDYPAHGEMVAFEDDGIIYIGGYIAENNFWFAGDDEYDNRPVNHPIYWERLTDMRERYEKQKGIITLFQEDE